MRAWAEPDTSRGAGHARLCFAGGRIAPDGVRLTVRRPGYPDDTLGPTGWQGAEAQLTPDAAHVEGDTLVLSVGPSVVAHMEPGMNIAVALVGPHGAVEDAQIAWPVIASPVGGARRRRGRLVATQHAEAAGAEMRQGSALIGDRGEQPAATAAGAAGLAAGAAAATDADAASAAPQSEYTAGSERDLAFLDELESRAAAKNGGAAEAKDGADTDDDASDTSDDADDGDAGETGESGRRGLEGEARAAAAAAQRKRHWGRRIGVMTLLALLALVLVTAAGLYIARDDVCRSASFGALALDVGLCDGVLMADEENTWNIDPLAWPGPNPPVLAEDDQPEDEPTEDNPVEDDPVEDDPTGEDPQAPDTDVADAGLPDPDAEADRGPQLTGREMARQFIATDPSGEDAFARGLEFLDEGFTDAAFLVFRYAAERQHPGAAMAVAQMYDPVTFSRETSPLLQANVALAQTWYERSADTGNLDALVNLGRMLIGEGDFEAAREVLERATENGAPGAEMLLNGLP